MEEVKETVKRRLTGEEKYIASTEMGKNLNGKG